MDITERKITKIAREAEKLVLHTMRETGVGTAEIDLIHALRHNPGCTQAALAELLHADKAAIARRTKNLPRRSRHRRQAEALRCRAENRRYAYGHRGRQDGQAPERAALHFH